MRYLFGDSAPFPLGYNFLETLEAFMEASTRIVQLDLESSALKRQIEEISTGRIKGLEALEQFHTVVMRAVQDTAQKVQHASALDYARAVAEFASRYVEENKRNATGANERDLGQLRADNDRRAGEQRGLLDGFLKVARIPVTSTRWSLRLVGEGKDARHTINGVFDNPEGIQTAFVLSTARVPAWNVPRKVSDFAQGAELMVGVEKSWLRGTVSPKQLVVDEWIITQADVSDDAFDLMIRRKMTEKESLFFRLRRSEQGIAGMVEHPGTPGAEALPGTLGPQDVAHLDRVWQALRLAMREITDKEQLLAVNLDGQPVFEAGLVLPFVVRLVGMFAPTVQEIARRSPNEFELTLKREAEGNRREELYLRKEELTRRLQPMPAAGRQIFAPLGLDSWVPGTTAVPPAVVPAPSSPPVPPGSNRALPQG